MGHRIAGKVVMVAGGVLVAGMALAQTTGPSVMQPVPSIVPVTGPSTGPDLPEATKPRLVPAAGATAPAPRTVKAVHKPGAKPVVKKASAPKRAKVAAPPAKTKQVTAAKRRVPGGQSVAGKPVKRGKRPAPARSGAAGSTVLPRV
jgi:hypothetical protein